MFETIGNLLTIALWVVAILLFGTGIFLCGSNLFKGTGWEKFWAVVALILGVVVFTRLYAWLNSVAWCLLLTGIELGTIGELGSRQPQSTPQKEKEKKYGITDAFLDTYCEYELHKQATKDAIRELDEGR